MTSETRENLRAVRHALLDLHKAILDVERAGYELAHGHVDSPHVLLQLVMHDPWFGWFRPVSELVVQMDELLDTDETVPDETVEGVFREIRSLINPTEEGEEFAVKYRRILQVDAGIILAHAELTRLLQV